MSELLVDNATASVTSRLDMGRMDVGSLTTRPLVSSEQLADLSSFQHVYDLAPERVPFFTKPSCSFRQSVYIVRIDAGLPTEPEYYPMISTRARVCQGAMCSIRLFIHTSIDSFGSRNMTLDVRRSNGSLINLDTFFSESYSAGRESDVALDETFRSKMTLNYQHYWGVDLPSLAWGAMEDVEFVVSLNKLQVVPYANSSWTHVALLVE